MFTVDDMVNLVNSYEAEQKAAAEPAAEPEQPIEQPAEEPAEQPAPDPTPVEPTPATQTDKDNNAFAEMRVANKAMEQTLKRVADAMGLKYTDSNNMMEQLNGDAFQKLSEKQGIPVEYLKRMEQLESQAQRWEAEETQRNLTQGFANLQSKYNLDNNALMSFAQQLDNSKVDLKNVDLEREYISRNMEAIVQARVNAAVQAALTKDAQVSGTAATPAQKGAGGSGDSGVSIKSAADLMNFLKGFDR